MKNAIDSKNELAISDARDRLLQSYNTSEECYIETQIKIIEEASFSQRHAKAWKVMNEVSGRKESSPPIKLNGSIDERKEKWRNYFCNLLGQPPKVPDNNFEISHVIDQILPIEEGPFTMQE